MTTDKGTETVQPRVSILIPAYNAENWIRQAIDSALAQTYPNKEVIVVDDGSTDGTRDVIRSFGEKICFVPSSHLGGNAARNLLLKTSSGEWLQYLDSDDYLLPGKVAGQIGELQANGDVFDVICSPYILRNENNGQERLIELALPLDVPGEYISWGRFWTGAFLMRRCALIEVGRWKEDQVACQEHELLLRFMRSGKRFGLWNEAAAVYRQHGTATVSKKDPLRTIRLRMYLTNQCEDFLRQEQRLNSVYSRLLYTARLDCARSAWKYDRAYAVELAKKASASGRRWVLGSPALPFRFQFVYFLLGFGRAQQMASSFRDGRVKC